MTGNTSNGQGYDKLKKNCAANAPQRRDTGSKIKNAGDRNSIIRYRRIGTGALSYIPAGEAKVLSKRLTA